MTAAHPAPSGLGEQALAQLQTLLVESERLEHFLKELVELTARALPVPVFCGITLAPEGRPSTAAASHELVESFDQEQYEVDEGPCLETLRTGRPNHVADTADEPRFGGFPKRAQEHGLGSMLALPLVPPGRAVAGVMNLYARDPGSFPAPVRDQAAVFAGYAAGALGVALRIDDQARFSEDLQQALASRAVIDQALGVIMAQERCTAERAFVILSRASQNRNVKLRQMAADIVTRVAGEPPAPRPLRARRQPPGGETAG